jgi:hypothetical protein
MTTLKEVTIPKTMTSAHDPETKYVGQCGFTKRIWMKNRRIVAHHLRRKKNPNGCRSTHNTAKRKTYPLQPNPKIEEPLRTTTSPNYTGTQKKKKKELQL